MWKIIKMLFVLWLAIGLFSCDSKLKEKYRATPEHHV
jgi:hypothetical protein